MIDRATMMPSIIAACPGFATVYDSFISEWSDTPDLPHYIVLADFSRYLIGLLEAGDTKELDSGFEIIERLHSEGDQFVRKAATIGILESLQNTNLHATTTPEQLIKFLRPTSLRYWHKVVDFWEKGIIITDD
jgi:hypothetical protein